MLVRLYLIAPKTCSGTLTRLFRRIDREYFLELGSLGFQTILFSRSGVARGSLPVCDNHEYNETRHGLSTPSTKISRSPWRPPRPRPQDQVLKRLWSR